MSNYDGDERFAGLPMAELNPLANPKATRAENAAARNARPLPAAAKAAWRLRIEGYRSTETFTEHVARFLDTVDTTRVTALLVGMWEPGESSKEAVRSLVDAADRLPALRHLYFGDIAQEENEISWILQSDITPLFEAFPRLETLIVQGGQDLVLEPVRHESLRHLEFRTGGLPGRVVRAVGASTFPALRTLELWLGTDEYGGDATVRDLEGILRAGGLPALTRLGLMNSEIQDEVATAVAASPVLGRLTELDLSMGALGNEGAEALLLGQPLGHLRVLNLSHHFITPAMQERLTAAFATPGLALDLGDPQEPDDDGEESWRYIAVAE